MSLANNLTVLLEIIGGFQQYKVKVTGAQEQSLEGHLNKQEAILRSYH